MSVVEHTLALVTPEGMPHERAIFARLRKEGFVVLNKRTVHLTPEQVSDFYQDRYGRDRDLPLLVASTSVSPVAVAAVGRPDAVRRLRAAAGPDDVPLAGREAPRSLNALYGNRRCNLAAVHASRDRAHARREILYFFPQSVVEPAASLEDNLRFVEAEVRPALRRGLERPAKGKPAEPALWLADWLMANDPRLPLAPQHLRHLPSTPDRKQ